MRYSCRAVVGHGQKCEPNYQCDACAAKQKYIPHIEKLEAALRDIIDERGICGHCGQLATGEGKRSFVICDKTVLGFKGPCHWTPQDPKDIARKALEGKDD
jgi:uncharacterized CHY-type Zn-finger protein